MKAPVFYSFVFLLFIISACGKSNDKQLEEDIAKIEQYLIDNNLTAEKTESGLHYIITQEGTGIKPIASSAVEVRYKGYFLDNRVFDETTGSETISFRLNGVIKGWTEGLQYYREGGKGTLLIPSALAYGSNPPQGIPSNEVLIFDIELVDVR
jgi:FKBP-type peptidyl-prolyl cis-trans isomerase FkpA